MGDKVNIMEQENKSDNVFKKIIKKLSPPAKVMAVFWTLCSLFMVTSEIHTFTQKVVVILFGYIFYCGIANLIYKILPHKNNKIDNNLPLKNEIIISQYSDLPRYYTINGRKYDIDNPKSISKIPLFKGTFFINGIEYGMDSVLMEHGSKTYSKNIEVHQASVEKGNEFRYNGIIFKTDKEKEEDRLREERWALQDLEKEKRKKQCDSFRIEDMYQFENILFEWHWVQSLFHTNGIAWFMLNMNNQYVAFKYINVLDKLIREFHEFMPELREFEIFMEEIDFNYPIPMHKNSIANTYVECVPYTKTGKKSKYPAILHFSSSETKNENGNIYQWHPYSGEIKILQDGNIGSAHISFSKNYTKFTFGLNGISLIIKRIDSIHGNIYKYEQ